MIFASAPQLTPVTIQMQKQLLVAHVNSMTAENHMKCERLQPKEGLNKPIKLLILRIPIR
ncbi:GH35 family endo-1,4-beta-xylanase [Anoxybacillus rupiensis]|nr:GH35 family endo-1,4-beta-xylanase [Anoxybacillus rupiensis]